MASSTMTTVITYDISRTRTRNRIAAILEDNAVRVQKSVFEARLTAPAAETLFERLTMLLDEGDTLRMYALSASGLLRSKAYGGAPICDDGDYWLL